MAWELQGRTNRDRCSIAAKIDEVLGVTGLSKELKQCDHSDNTKSQARIHGNSKILEKKKVQENVERMLQDGKSREADIVGQKEEYQVLQTA